MAKKKTAKGAKRSTHRTAAPAAAPAPRELTSAERKAWAALDGFAATVAPAAAHELRAAVGELLTGKGA